jgi:outer membrane protein TolC
MARAVSSVFRFISAGIFAWSTSVHAQAGNLSAGQAQPAENLSLRDAIGLAIQQNPNHLETREKIRQADTEAPVARSYILPNLSAVVNADHDKAAVNNDKPLFNGDPYNNYNASLKLSQMLFQIGSISAISSAHKDEQISRLNAQISERDLTNNVIQSYFQIVLSARNVQTLMNQQKIALEALKVAQRREHTGRGQLLDVLQAKTQLSLLDGQLATAQNQLQVAAATLANNLGEYKKSNFNIPDKMDAPLIEDIDRVVDLKNYKIPELERADLSISKIDDQKRELWGQNLPYLSIIGNYTYSSYKQSDWINQDANSWGIGLQLTIPLFSGFSTFYQQRALESQKLQLQYEKTAELDQVSYQQVTSRKNLETARSSIATGEEALKLALASQKEAQRNYNFATIDFLQFLSVQQAYIQAEQSLNLYKYNYIVALGNYFAASGQSMQQLVDLLEKANL